MRVRYLMALLVGAMVVLFDPVTLAAGAAVVAILVASNLVGHRYVSRLHDPRGTRRFAAAMTTVDAVAAVATYAIFLRDADAMPVALLAFVAFELALRWGRGLAAVGLVAFLLALAGRAYVQVELLGRASPRVELLLLWAVVAMLLVALGRELQGQERRWREQAAARAQVAADLQATVARTLSAAGIPERAATHQEVLAALHAIVEDEAVARDQLIERIATVLALPHHGLSPREQEILLLLARGHTDARIAAALFISPSTVRNHLANMRTKLELDSRAQLQAFASRYAIPV